METFQLTIQQKRILLMEQKRQGKGMFNLVYVCKYSFKVDPQIMKNVLNSIVQINDFFHIRLVKKKNNIVQEFVCPNALKYDYVDLKKEKEKKEEIFNKILEQEKKREYDLFKGDLYHFVLVGFDENTYCLIINLHHIIADANCVMNLRKKILDFYNIISDNKNLDNKSVNSYKKYVIEQQNYKKSSKYTEIKDYWHNMDNLQSYSDIVDQRKIKSKKRIIHIVDKDFKDIIVKMFETKIPIVSYLLSALYILMFIYNGSNNSAIGFVSKGKKRELKDSSINGLFSLLVPFLLDLDVFTDISMIPHLVNSHLKDIIDNQMYDFSEDREISEMAMNFPIIFNMKERFQLYKSGEYGEEDVKYIDSDYLQYNLVLNIYQSNNDICIELEYNNEQYTDKFIERMTQHYVYILQSLVGKDVHKSLGDINVMNRVEMDTVDSFSRGKQIVIKNDSLKEWFLNTINTNCKKVAIYEGEHIITFKELDELSDRCADYLKAIGVKENNVVISMVERGGFEFVIFWALIKLDCIYLPVSTDIPIDRLKYIKNECKPAGILTSQNINFHSELIKLDKDYFSDLRFYKFSDENIKVYDENLRYIIYTSGTSGTPKGVKICEDGIKNLGYFFLNELRISSKDNMLLFFNPAFDASIWEVLILFFVGCSVTVVDEVTRSVPSLMEEFINKNNITFFTTTPSYLSLLNPEQVVGSLRMVIAAGEQSIAKDVVKWNKYIKYVNAYGPTETTICSSIQVCDEKDYDYVPIGHPICNTKLYILDKNLKQVPIGIKGEICIGGVGVSCGYVEAKENENSRFVKSEDGEVLYRTNDIGRWNENGEVIYEGRLDNQIKINGYRIELEEIESAILKINMIQNASVIYDKVLNQLVVYYCAEIAIPNDIFVKVLYDKLPYYMIPRKYIRIKNMPINNNNKIDKKKLCITDDSLQEVCIEKYNSIERQVFEIWKDILESDIRSIDDNFFDIGGDSLKLFMLFDKMRNKFGNYINIIDLFSYTTIREMSRYIQSVNRDKVGINGYEK